MGEILSFQPQTFVLWFQKCYTPTILVCFSGMTISSTQNKHGDKEGFFFYHLLLS